MKRDDLRRISRQLRRLERTPRNTDRSTHQPRFVQAVDHVILRANGAITALSGSVPGTGSAVVYDQSSVGSTLVSRGSSVTVVNLGGVIADTTFFSAHRAPPNQPVWLADTAQAPSSPGSGTGSAYPSVSRVNTTDQFVIGSTQATIAFQSQQQFYPAGSSAAYTWSTTANELRCSADGLYHITWMIQASPTAADQGRMFVRDDGALITGTRQTWALGPQGLVWLTGSLYHPVLSSTHAISFYIEEDTGGATLVVFGSTIKNYARFDVRKVGEL